MKRIILFIVTLSLALSLASCSGGGESIDSCAVILSQKNANLSGIGTVLMLTAEVYEDGIRVSQSEADKNIKWSSTDDSVAVYRDGAVISTGYGACVIRATYKDNVSASCSVTVPNPNPMLSISQKEVELGNIGESIKITAKSDKNEDISDKVTWVTSNEKVATCTKGLITAIGYGSCTITAISPEQRKTAICTVTVDDPTAPKVTLSSEFLQLDVGNSHTLTAEKANNSGSDIIWMSSDESIATCIDGTVVAKGRGVCAIIASTEKGHTDYCIVSVGDNSPNLKHEEYLKFDYPDLYKELKYIDKQSGKLISRSVVTSYRMDTQLLDDGRLVVEITLNCVKVYDVDGVAGTSLAAITTELYRENDVFCDKKQYKIPDIKLGETYSVKCSGFTVQTNTNGKAREFYMNFSSITEL